MSIIIEPREFFGIVRQLDDHLDTDTNFVQAVIRNARTDALIETVDLTDQGSRRFQAEWQSPADTSGQGFYVSIVTTVYTDSGFTTKNENYGEEENTYLIDRRNKNIGGGHDGSVDLRKRNFETISELIKDAVENRSGKAQVFSDVNLLKSSKNLEAKVKNIDTILELLQKVDGKEVDLSSIIESLNGLKNGLTGTMAGLDKAVAQLSKQLTTTLVSEVVKQFSTQKNAIEEIFKGKKIELDKKLEEMIKKALEDAGEKMVKTLENKKVTLSQNLSVSDGEPEVKKEAKPLKGFRKVLRN